MQSYQQLKKIFKRLSHLVYIQRILMWDEAVMMPEGAGSERASALATLNLTIQKLLNNKKVKKLLESAKQEDNLPPWDTANLVWMEKKYKRASCISSKLTEESTKAAILCEQAWRKLRAENNWQAFLPYLSQSFEFVKEIANRRAEALNLSPYDTCIDEYASGFNQKNIDVIFDELKNTLPQLVQAIITKQQPDEVKIPQGPFSKDKQKALGLTVMQALGFDFNHGRLDVSHHPFCSGGASDVRITTRYFDNEFIQSLMAICHETGHALYEQGLPRKWINQPVGHVESMAMHESQSLLMEMEVCCSAEFYSFLTPSIEHEFGKQSAITAANLYKLVTKVKPGLIRVEADEATYPLHVILRYEIEKKLFNGELRLQDLPAYWDELMVKYLGLSTKTNYQNGVMQDVHWPAGAFGYFPAYTLGRLIAAQLFASYKQHNPNFSSDIKSGNFQTLRQWLKQNVYDYASSLPTQAFLIKVTGTDLNPSFFLNHIEQRYLK